ncbi:hypothetical protein TSAR_005689 [Trichomalopsis sarcophagae]|uniref:DUF4806 domain-containing protein n=1 Tax=Trichomalopsis sarcophagae TaxID=543379 RepID=A0A232FI82_9HYME|nr:hypothetical protein TSAR_005689 [Trichomalopsis sarcophagae]
MSQNLSRDNRLRVRNYRLRQKLQKNRPLDEDESTSEEETADKKRKEEFTLNKIEEKTVKNALQQQTVQENPESMDNVHEEPTTTATFQKLECDSIDENDFRFSSDEDFDTDDSDISDNQNDSSTSAYTIDSQEDSTIITDMRKWFYNHPIPYNHLDALLKTLHPYHPELPLTSKTLLKIPVQKMYEVKKFNPDDPSDDSEFLYIGIGDQLRRIVKPDQHEDLNLDLQFSVDGLPLFHSSSVEFWPILGRVHTATKLYDPFVIAIHSGRGKPKSVKKYLEKFIEELNKLLREGIEIEKFIEELNKLLREGIEIGEKHFTINVMCIICDAPARVFIKCIKGHTGYYACERCCVKGCQINRRTVFPVDDLVMRTDTSFRTQDNIEHHHDDVNNFDCSLSDITAFPFENKLGQIKKSIRSGRKPLHQFCRKKTNIEQVPADHMVRTVAMSPKKIINFAAVKIIDDKYPDLLNNIITFPMTFLNLNEHNEATVRYLVTPHTNDDKDFIIGMLSTVNAPPPDNWASMPCELINGYVTYEDAEKHQKNTLVTETEELVRQLSTLHRNNTTLAEEMNMLTAATESVTSPVADTTQSLDNSAGLSLDDDNNITMEALSPKKIINFAAVKIIDDKYPDLLNNIITVPMTFLNLNEHNEATVRYLETPHTNDDKDFIIGMLSTVNAPPPYSWASMACELINGYATYEDAEKHQENTLVTETEELVWQLSTLHRNNSTLAEEMNMLTAATESVTSPVADTTQSLDNSAGLSLDDDNNITMEAVTMDWNDICTKSDISGLKSYFDNFLKEFIKESEDRMKGFKTKQKSICQDIKNIDTKITNMQKDVDDIKTYIAENRQFAENENIITLDKIVEKYELSFPMKSLEDFKSFDEKLTEDLYDDLKKFFICSTNTKIQELKSCTQLFRRFFARELMITFTAQKKSKGKEAVFKDTRFFACYFESMKHVYAKIKVVTDIDLLKLIGIVINNANDWDGFRLKRAKLEDKNPED